MFRKPKRNFRQRIVKNESDDENGDDRMETEDTDDTMDIKPPLFTNKIKEKKKKEKNKTVLSFDHEEGIIGFRDIIPTTYPGTTIIRPRNHIFLRS